MSSQVVAAHDSNLAFYLNMWSGTCGEHHMNKSTSDNDDTHNVIFEVEDGQAFTGYDPTSHVSRNLNENELDCSNEDEEYMEPNHNDLDHELGNVSFDPYIDSIPMDDDPIEPRPLEVEFYEPTKESPQGTDVRREWMIPGNQDCSIQIILIMI